MSSTTIQHAIFADGRVNGVPASLLIDTGAAVTLVHRRLWERGRTTSRRKVELCDSPSGGPIVAANGEPLRILGLARSSICLAGVEFAHDVFITEDVGPDCILGADFLISHGFVVDLKAGVLRRGFSSTPLLQRPSEVSAVCRVSVSSNTTVRAGEERLLWADVNCCSSSLTGTAGVIEPKEGFEERHQLLLARVVAVPDHGQVPIRVANLSSSSVTLHRGTNIGHFCPLAEPGSTAAETAEYCELSVASGQEQFLQVHQIGSPCSAADFLGIDTSSMSQQQKDSLEELVRDFRGVFSTSKQDVGRTDLVYHNISTGDAAPIRQPPRRLPLHYKQEVDTMLDDMLQQGVIEPSHSPWSSPVILVKKKDGSLRFCIDYRKLNQVTQKDCYPLPRVDDLLDSLSDAQWFTTLDLRSGYWQVEVNPRDREKTAFPTPHGLFQFRVMPFGLCNAPSTFQRLMELVLVGLRWEVCLAYLDDIIIFGRTWEEHLQRLRAVFTRLKEAHLKVHPKSANSFGRV